jgi:hypothetical protein
VSLLESQKRLLCELVDAVRAADPDNPRVRATTAGSSGARVFIHGRPSKELPGRRPHADIDELRAQGYLRHLETSAGNAYFAVTPVAHAERDRLAAATRTPAAKRRPSEPAPEFETAQSYLDRLQVLANAARSALDTLFEVSGVEERFGLGDGVITPYPWRWQALEPRHRPILGEAKDRLDEWLTTARRVFVSTSPAHLSDFEDAAGRLMDAVDRASSGHGPAASTVPEAREYVLEALNSQLALLDELPAAHRQASTLIVPDTNALVADPDLESWVVPEPATIVIAAQVVAELDSKKQDPTIGKKASSLIKRFKEYARRGDTKRGVRLAGQRLFREIALHPDMSQFPELDSANADDRILATALQLAHRELTSVVIVVTRDRNAANKARHLELPAVDVADV